MKGYIFVAAVVAGVAAWAIYNAPEERETESPLLQSYPAPATSTPLPTARVFPPLACVTTAGTGSDYDEFGEDAAYLLLLENAVRGRDFGSLLYADYVSVHPCDADSYGVALTDVDAASFLDALWLDTVTPQGLYSLGRGRYVVLFAGANAASQAYYPTPRPEVTPDRPMPEVVGSDVIGFRVSVALDGPTPSPGSLSGGVVTDLYVCEDGYHIGACNLVDVFGQETYWTWED